ncbi:MAG: HAMP domain-containing histidine kinase [candidate division Zixibacteria bacterium]|nr:HAMP domain-containing histidine kinase [candidate division Zixibacteria bacterium]
MKAGRSHDPSKFALAVFVALVIFCIAQLSWWIVFQIERTSEVTQTQLELLNLRIGQVINIANNDFLNCVKIADEAVRLSSGDTELLQSELDRLLSDPAVIGYSITDSGAAQRSGGRIDSTLHAIVSNGCIIYFDAEYPHLLFPSQLAEDLAFSIEGIHDGSESTWVASDMIQVPDAIQESLDSEAHRRIMMFLSEGGFFLLLILFGAYLIYRALQRSEDLKFRQQHFLQAVTHEFRAPLTSLRLYLEALQSGNVDEQLAAELFPKMLDDCERLDGLIDNVLEAGHFGKSGYELNLSETDLSDDLNEYLDGLEPLVTRLDGKMHRSVEEKVTVKSDYQALRRVVRALIDNALRYSPPDKRTIEVSLKRVEESAEIRITDHGIGVSKDEQARIFDRFYRVSDNYARGVSGTGLGLFLAREIIEAHGGNIVVHSKGQDHGSAFIITLPLQEK